MFPNDISEGIYSALGKVVVSFSMLEHALHFLAWGLINSEQRVGRIVTTELSFRSLKALVSSLIRDRVAIPDVIERMDEALALSTRAEERRNLLMHSIWILGETPDEVTRFKTTAKERKGLKAQRELLSAVRINETIELILSANRAVEEVSLNLRMIGQFAVRRVDDFFRAVRTHRILPRSREMLEAIFQFSAERSFA
jgi:hypothetical protein